MASLPSSSPHVGRESRAVEAGRGLAAVRLARTLGLELLLAGLVQYESWASRVVLGRWSVAAAGVIALVALATLSSTLDTVRRALRWRTASNAVARGALTPSVAVAFFDLALFLFGSAYLVAALDDREAGGRLLELDLLGSLHPLSIALDWLAMAAAALGTLELGWRRLRPRIPGLFVLLATTLVIFVVGEGVTRAVNVLFPQTQGFPTASTHLWMRRFGTLNSLGYRDPEPEQTRAPGTLRLLLVGDSFTFAMGVDRVVDRVSDLLRAELPARLGNSVDVVNAGRPYTHTLQHIEALDRLLSLQPDLVLLVYVFNDIDYLRSSDKPSTALANEGSLFGRIHPMRILYLNSFLVQQVYLRVRHLYWSLAPSSELPVSAYHDPALVERHIADLRRFVERASSAGAVVRIVPFNPAFAVMTPEQEARRKFLDAASAAGLPIWRLDHVFDGEDYAALVVNPMDHHPNAHANRLLADALAEELSRWAAGGGN